MGESQGKPRGVVPRGIVWVLILQLILPVGVTSASPLNAKEILLSVPADELGRAVFEATADPFIEALKAADDIPRDVGIDRADPTLDHDPFFLRAQQWISINQNHENRPETDEDTPWFESNPGDLTLQIPGAAKAWSLRASLIPILFTDEFILLTAQQGSRLARGEGLFLVRTPDLVRSSYKEENVPVYFFPLPGTGWTGGLQAQEFPRQNLIVVTNNGGESLSLELDDLETVVQVENLNLLMALGTAAKSLGDILIHHPQASRALAELNAVYENLSQDVRRTTTTLQDQVPRRRLDELLQASSHLMASIQNLSLLPPRGSTAGFGIFYTGYDLEHPQHSEFAMAATNPLTSLAEKIVAKLWIPSARALTQEEGTPQPNQLTGRLLRVAAICGVALIASIVLKYTVFKKVFAKRRAQEEAAQAAQNPGAPVVKPGLLRRLGRELRDIHDVLAHSLTVINQFANVWFGNGTEFVGDRVAPHLMAADNTLVRRFLNHTVYFARDASSQVPVNAKTLVLGAAVMGSIDTGMYYVQLYHVVPAIGQSIAHSIPALQSRVDHAFAPNNPNTAALNQYEVARCGASWAASGASSFSIGLQGQIIQAVQKEVDDELKREGRNPHDITNLSERDRRIRARLNRAMTQMGLPGPDAFLFDANTIYSNSLRLLGYSVPTMTGSLRTPQENTISTTPPPQPAFYGAKRPGLIIPATRKALEYARVRLTRHRAEGREDPQAEEAIHLLEETLRDLSALDSFVRTPLATLWYGPGTLTTRLQNAKTQLLHLARRFKNVRQELMALTYEGPASAELQNIPGHWFDRAGTASATLAADFFRRSYMGYLSGDPLVLGPTNEQREEFRERATPYAERSFITSHQQEYNTLSARRGTAEALRQLQQSYPVEYESLFEEQVTEFARDAEALRTNRVNTSYKPPRKDFVARWQERRATRKAEKAFTQEFHESFDADTATAAQQQRYQELYARALMDTLGLHPDYTDNEGLKNLVEGLTRASVDKQIQSDPELAAYIQDLRPTQRIQFLSSLYAENLMSSYMNTTLNSGLVDPLSPAQPGRLQRLRQTKFFRKSRFLTRIARTVEALVPDNAYRPGWRGVLDRNLPAWADFRLANNRAYRSAVTGATASYQFNSLLWGIRLSPAMWTLNLLSRFTVSAPEQFLNRAFRMQGVQPMSRVSRILVFALVYSWATFWGSIPIQIFASDFQHLWNWASQGVQGILSGPTHWVRDVVDSCRTALGG